MSTFLPHFYANAILARPHIWRRDGVRNSTEGTRKTVKGWTEFKGVDYLPFEKLDSCKDSDGHVGFRGVSEG